MALSPGRRIRAAETEFPWERGAIDFVVDALPDSDPHTAWELCELFDPGTGRLYEIDLMVLSRSGLFLIEIKSHRGELTGDQQDWTFTEDNGKRRYLDCPYPTTNHKARVLGSLLGYKMDVRPFVQPLVFVSDPAVTINLRGGTPQWLVTPETIRKTLVHGLPSSRGPVVNRPMMGRLRDVFRQLGLKPSEGHRRVGGFSLKHVVDEGEGYQEFHATGTVVETDTARVRCYLVPRATSTDRKRELEAAAEREARVLSQLGQHPNILSYRAFVPDGPLGPAVIFEPFERGLPLPIFLKTEPDLSERVQAI